MTGTLTINSGVFLRVGTIGGDDNSGAANNANPGTAGTLGSASVVNNGTLSFTHTDAITVANAISGTGSVRIGSGLAGTENQNVTFSGSKTYSGNTAINRGTLTLDATGSIGNSSNIFMVPPPGFTATFDVSAVVGGYTLNSGQTRMALKYGVKVLEAIS
jgi:autotransporter-associated beta strand protein